MKMFIAAACFGTLAVTALGMAGETAAAPSVARVDPTQFDTVYVDVSCRGG